MVKIVIKSITTLINLKLIFSKQFLKKRKPLFSNNIPVIIYYLQNLCKFFLLLPNESKSKLFFFKWVNNIIKVLKAQEIKKKESRNILRFILNISIINKKFK